MFTLMLISVIVSTLFFIVWLILYFKYKNKFVGLLDDVDGNIFILKDLYFLGLGCIEIYERMKERKITANEKAIEEMKKLAEVFGRNKAELYYYVLVSANISLILTFVPIGAMLICILQSIYGVICGILIDFAMIYGIRSSINTALANKKDAIISEFPKMVSKLTLLINAGMRVRRAWEEVANSNTEEELYSEMRLTSKDIKEGMSIEQAMEDFASRCSIKEIRKFSSIYVQAINMGASETINSMKAMSDEAWQQKKQLSKQKGEIASQKLLIPNMIMFIGIIVIVVVPMLISMLGSI